ncbi:MAG: aminotransferase class I/II-fold pyridoxal phosphate-dependent enzyme [Parvularculaceae bacterium]
MKPETLAIHVPQKRRDGAIAPPIHLSTTFEHGPASERLFEYEYIRSANPNVNDLESRRARLERGCGAGVISSGMAAGAALFNTLQPGSELLFHKDVYFDFKNLAQTLLPNSGLRARFIDLRDEDAVDRALSGKTALVCFETPSNPRLEIIDIKAISDKAHRVGAKILVDSTFATPALQNPLALGADYALHSLTKYVGGHSDVQGGAIVVADQPDMVEKLVAVRTLSGGVLSPFNAWMLARGLQTLHCRMEKHSANALQIAQMLSRHRHVEQVRYPFLETNPDLTIAKKQMSAGGGMLSFELAGGREAALRVASEVRLFINATSLGGVESLIEHRASMEGPGSSAPGGLLRLSIGLEHPDDLIEDLERALGKL